jgi:hypothetical protein
MSTCTERRCLSHERELESSQTSLSLALSRKRERERASVFHKRESDVRKLPSPTCGRGAGGEGAVCQRIRISRVPKAPLPNPLPGGARGWVMPRRNGLCTLNPLSYLRERGSSGLPTVTSTCAEAHCLSHKREGVRKLPSPTRGRGVGGEGPLFQRIHISRVPKAPLPNPPPARSTPAGTPLLRSDPSAVPRGARGWIMPGGTGCAHSIPLSHSWERGRGEGRRA